MGACLKEEAEGIERPAAGHAEGIPTVADGGEPHVR
jgi:hypothetical protein